MNDRAAPPATSSLQDIASSSEFAEISRLLNALRHISAPSPRDPQCGNHRAVAQEVRQQSRSMPTSTLRASVHRTLQLLDKRPPVDPQAYAACRRRLGTLMSQRAVADDWIARLQVSWVYKHKHLLALSGWRLPEGAAYHIASKQAPISCPAEAGKSDIEIDPAVDPLPTRNETTTRSTKRPVCEIRSA